MLKKFLVYYKPHIKMFSLDMTASMLVALIGIVYPIMTNKMLTSFTTRDNLMNVVWAGLILLALYLIRLGLMYFIQYYGHMIGVGMQQQMRRDMFEHLQKLPYTFFDNNETGTIMSRITSDLFDISELAHHGPENIIISSLTVIGSFIYLCTINIPLTLIIFLCVPILCVTSFYFRRKMRSAFKERRVTNAIINASIESSITGIRVTKAFNNSQKEREKFSDSLNKFAEACRKSYSAMAKFHSSSSFITDIFNVVIIIAGGIFLLNQKISVANYTAFIVSVNVFINPVTTLINFTEQFQDGATGFARFLEIMDEPPEKESPYAMPINNVVGNIEFKDVCFAYDTKQNDALDNISFKIEAGKKVALVGESGGGKTTICHLIPRFYVQYSGEVLIDGTSTENITLEALRKNIGIVQQDVFLFAGSIKDNILYGNLNATEEEMITAAKRANIYDFVMSLPNGFDTEIGERGVKLSGGQKQRLSIARVFLKNPAILILDEATSALDNTSEIMIQSALDELCKGRTTLVVAHRLSTIKNADEIIVVENGKITEQGTHDQLIDKNGTYAELYNLQFRG